jgi:Mn2+/Fe2+ NRAMP family transporter
MEVKSELKEERAAPWSLRPARLGWRAILALGAGSVIASFYIGTGDISIATTMGAKFGYRLWWTYFALGIAAWALIDMSVRYYLRFNRTPMALFRDVHPIFVVYMFLAVVVCTIFGSYNQWAACAMVISGFFPNVPLEVGGMAASLAGLLFLLTGAYARVERIFVIGLLALILCFFGAAFMVGINWGAASSGLVPHVPARDEFSLCMSNAGSMINAWLILIYPYTMVERGLYREHLQGKVDVLHRSRLDYGWGILAAGIIALPVIAAASAVARPFGILPRSYMDLSVLLEPLAGTWSMQLFLGGLFLAAWTSGVGWWMCGCYALLDLFNLPIRLDTSHMRLLLILFAIPSSLLLLLRINPVYQMLIFSAFLAVVFPVIGLVMLWRITRPDMGYFRWSLHSPRGVLIAAADIFAVGLSLYIGWRDIGALFRH